MAVIRAWILPGYHVSIRYRWHGGHSHSNPADPQRWIERYPSLTWTLVASWLRPNQYRPIQHSARVVNVMETFVLAEMRIATLIEEISSFDIQAVGHKLANHRLNKLSKAIASPGDRYGRQYRDRVQAVYDCVSVHTLNLDMLETFVWMFGLSDLVALKRSVPHITLCIFRLARVLVLKNVLSILWTGSCPHPSIWISSSTIRISP